MRGVNRMVVVGRVGRDPEVHRREGSVTLCSPSVATNRPRREGEQWVEVTDWHQVKVFGAQAERCAQFLRSGSMVGVEGLMAYDTWVDSEGRKRFSAKLHADRVSFLTDLRAREEQQVEAN